MINSGNISSLSSTLSVFQSIVIADYQRNYSWESGNINDLWEDLKLLAFKNEPHFFGSLILQHVDEKKQSCEIVDGQQRITTIFLFMARLRDELVKLPVHSIPPENEDDREINVLVDIEDFLYKGGKTTPRFQTNLLIKKSFDAALKKESKQFTSTAKELLIPKRDKGIDKRITLAFRNSFWQIKKLIEEDLAEKTNDEKLFRIRNLSNVISESLMVLPIFTSETSESLEIFMTINDRGLPLGTFDLVRGHILKAVTLKMTDTQRLKKFSDIHGEWTIALQNLSNSNPDKFLRHYLLSISSKSITSRKVSSVALDLIQNGPTKGTPAQRADHMWKDILAGSQIYAELKDPTTRAFVKKLRVMNIVADSYRILLLRVMDTKIGLTQAQIESILNETYKISLTWPIMGKNAQDLEGHFQQVASSLKSQKDVTSVLAKLKKLGSFSFDSKDFVKDGMSNVWAKALLLALEFDLSGAANSLKPEDLQIEHVAPQTSTSIWETALELKSDKYTVQIGRIGNLSLIDIPMNPTVKQDPFSIKKKEYKNSRCNMLRDFQSIPKWDSSMIELREDWFIEQINGILGTKPKKAKPFSVWVKKPNR